MTALTNLVKNENIIITSPEKSGGIDILDIVKKVVKLATVVEGEPKAPFSIATTPRCRGGRDFFSWIAPLYPWSLPYNAEC